MGMIGFPETSVTINERCVTSQKSEYFTLVAVGVGVATTLGTRWSGFQSSVEIKDIYLLKNA